MSRNTKIVLGIVGALLVICCAAVVIVAAVLPGIAEEALGEVVVEDSQQAAEVGQSIISYDLPPGFREEAAMQLLGNNMVFINSPNSGMFIMLMEVNEALGGNEANLQEQMEQAFAQQSGSGGFNFAFVSSEELVINDETVTLNRFEGTGENGEKMRQETAAFQAASGNTAMLMITGPVDGWNDNDVEDFVDSLR